MPDTKVRYDIKLLNDDHFKTYVGDTKTKAGIRAVPLTVTAEKLLQMQRAKRNKEKLAVGAL